MESSKKLLDIAIKSLEEANISLEQWALGGGTVLYHKYHHRISKDIDIFLQDPQLLNYLSPRVNSFTENCLDYDEMSSYLTLTMPEGKIDFINSFQISSFKPKLQEFFGHEIFVEDPIEIVSKKMFYRGTFLRPRDIYDLATVYSSDRKDDLISALTGIKKKHKILFQLFPKP